MFSHDAAHRKMKMTSNGLMEIYQINDFIL